MVERQFPMDLHRANAMMNPANLTPVRRQKHRQDAIKYSSTMANISIKDGMPPYEKFFGKTTVITISTHGKFWKNWIYEYWLYIKK
jgi:hypothetical protein